MSSLKNTLNKDDLSVLSDYAYDQLGIEMKISSRSYKELLGFDDYKAIDEFIIKPMGEEILGGTINSKEVQEVIAKRKDGKWYGFYAAAYDGMLYGLRVIEKIRSSDYEMPSFKQAVVNCASSWYEVDFCYRQFCKAIQDGGIDYLSEMKTLVDNKYLNSFLRPLNEEWSKVAVSFLKSGWKNSLMCIGQKFYPYYVEKILSERRTAVVIISEANRYEVDK